ncbi:aldehyde dehydrogenase [Humibacillus sp. DSM 29435]|uniref:aldehyde dehydrogenase family protein n=1 Tax=Humibacillus sp. DSM 29435 TaxID=1869167 RepID=UPI000871D85A|nr:aldehyde dehydrogenase family protein [Humibacillus sp. DSM 29435]OFE15914.1 aldehyde dehydrogenase [Humibacillus sp. DSM 29435]
MTTQSNAPTFAPTPKGELSDDDRARLDAIVAGMARGESVWAAMDLPARADLLADVHRSVAAAADAWVAAAVRAKGLDPKSPLVGEEWLSGPYCTLTALLALQHSLKALASGGSPVDGKRLGTAPGGRVTVPALPSNRFEYLLLHGFTADVWMTPGVSAAQVQSRAGLGARTPSETGGVGLVLGAGNITSIAPLDVLYELVAHNRVVVLKLNPTLDELLPAYEAAFAPLIDRGLLAIVAGGGDVGGYLAQHEGISHVHITGSAATHDLIVWGRGEDAAQRRAAGTPLLETPITSELGGVSPIIVVPGDWSSADLAFQAAHVATQRLHNGGYNCIAGQVVVLSSDWAQREAFVEQLRVAMDKAPGRAPWYPRSAERVADAAASYSDAQRLGPDGGRLLIDARGSDAASIVETTEYFSPVLGIVDVPGTGQAFLDAAVDLVNHDFVGTLGANLLVDPATMKTLGNGFEEAVARLEYGTVAINAWTGVGFLTANASWGAFPGHTLDNVQSGIGVVHNALLLADVERTVVRGPFRPFPRSAVGGEFALSPKPPWFVSARSARTTGELLTRFAADPSWAKLPRIFGSAFLA